MVLCCPGIAFSREEHRTAQSTRAENNTMSPRYRQALIKVELKQRLCEELKCARARKVNPVEIGPEKRGDHHETNVHVSYIGT